MEMQEDDAILMEENSTLIMKDKSVQVCVEEETPLKFLLHIWNSFLTIADKGSSPLS